MKFAVEQRMGAAVMLLQEVRIWQKKSQGVLTGYELYTDIDLDTAVAIPRDFACDVREKVLSKRYTFVVLFGTVWGSVHLPCHGDISQDDLWSMLKEMEDVVINLLRRHRTSRIVIGSDLNVSLAPSLEGFDRFPYSFKCKWCTISLALSCDRVDAFPSFTSSVHI